MKNNIVEVEAKILRRKLQTLIEQVPALTRHELEQRLVSIGKYINPSAHKVM